MKKWMPYGLFRKTVGGMALVAIVVGSALGSMPASSSQSSDFSQVAARAEAMEQSLESGNWLAIGADRHALADAVAPFVGVESSALEDAWALADPRRQTVIYTALSQLGKPYVTNGESPDVGFDCSGLTKYSWSKAGVTLEHQSEAQVRQGEARTFASAQPGDLVHYPGHIGMYLGAGRAIVHAVNHETDLAIGIASEHTKNVIAPLS
jgi:cell wall-associated NlpC family hydrolase